MIVSFVHTLKKDTGVIVHNNRTKQYYTSYAQRDGIQGDCYDICLKTNEDTWRNRESLEKSINRLITYMENHPKTLFIITRPITKHFDELCLGQLFSHVPDNCILPLTFIKK